MKKFDLSGVESIKDWKLERKSSLGLTHLTVMQTTDSVDAVASTWIECFVPQDTVCFDCSCIDIGGLSYWFGVIDLMIWRMTSRERKLVWVREVGVQVIESLSNTEGKNHSVLIWYNKNQGNRFRLELACQEMSYCSKASLVIRIWLWYCLHHSNSS